MRLHSRLFAILSMAVLCLGTAAVPVGAAEAVRWDMNGIRSLIANRVAEGRKAVGIIVGLVDPSGRRVVAGGATAPGGNAVPEEDTVFEIGSITKVFTSLLLADMLEKGEIEGEEPLTKYLPAGTTVPSRNGREIVLYDLSMQDSGLPRMPDNFKPADPENPYIDYGPDRLYAFLSGYKLTRDIGQKYEYSNTGVGLLGHILSLRAGLSYEELVRKRVLEPLGMKDTAVTLPESLKARLAPGSGPDLKPVKNWDWAATSVLAGAGALRSTAADMMKFLAAAMEIEETPLRPAFRRMLHSRRPTGTPGLDIAMGWHIFHRFGPDIVWHNGGTGGYRSFAGFDPTRKAGVVVLCNTAFGVDDIGLHALDPRYEAGRYSPPRERKAVKLGAALLEACVGEYELAQGILIAVSRSADRLYARTTGQAQFEIFPENPVEFFMKSLDIQFTFVKDAKGLVTGLVIHQNGFDRNARKIK